MKKKLFILCCLLLCSGCNKTNQVTMTENIIPEISVFDSVVADEKGNTGLYITQDIEDIIPTAYKSQKDEEQENIFETEELTESETITDFNEIIQDNFYETNDVIQAIYDVNIRDGIGSENSNVLSYLPTGEIAQRFSTNDDWSFIIYNGIKGYVYNEYIQKVE